MTIIGEGIMRECCDCHINIGCYQPETSEQCDCENCRDKVCPDTPDTSHGLCGLCLQKAKDRRENSKVQ